MDTKRYLLVDFAFVPYVVYYLLSKELNKTKPTRVNKSNLHKLVSGSFKIFARDFYRNSLTKNDNQQRLTSHKTAQ